MGGGGASSSNKKAFKGIQFVDKVEVASEEKLKSISFTSAPKARNTKKNARKRGGKNKSKSKTKETTGNTVDAPVTEKKEDNVSIQVSNENEAVVVKQGGTQSQSQPEASSSAVEVVDNVDYGIRAIIEDRVDCLMGLDGDIAKFQIVGSLALNFENKLEEDSILTLKLLSLPSAKIFNPKRVKQTVEEDIINVKCVKDDESINVLKYKWKCDDPSSVCPLKLSLEYINIDEKQDDGNGNLVNVSIIKCNVIKNINMENVIVSSLSILGTIEMDNGNGKLLQCIESLPTRMNEDETDVNSTNNNSNNNSNIDNNCEFHWSQEYAHKFMFKLNNDAKENILNNNKLFLCKFSRLDGNIKKVQIKATFEINNYGISNIGIIGGTREHTQMIRKEHNTNRVVNGDYIITDQK